MKTGFWIYANLTDDKGVTYKVPIYIDYVDGIGNFSAKVSYPVTSVWFSADPKMKLEGGHVQLIGELAAELDDDAPIELEVQKDGFLTGFVYRQPPEKPKPAGPDRVPPFKFELLEPEINKFVLLPVDDDPVLSPKLKAAIQAKMAASTSHPAKKKRKFLPGIFGTNSTSGAGGKKKTHKRTLLDKILGRNKREVPSF
jgi:hypothetical protein